MTTWFVTGTSSGFGRSVTEQLLRRGDTVAATLRRPERLDDLRREHGDRLWVRELDVTDTARLREVVAEAFAELGRIDVVLSNAGAGVFGAVEELTDAHIASSIATNLTASMQLARAVLPHLRAQGGGRLLQMGSMGGHLAVPGFASYHVAKWGIEGFYESLAPEVEPFGIRTTVIEPGVVRTPSFDAAPREEPLPAYAGHPAIRRAAFAVEDMPGDQEKVAAAIVDLGDATDPPRRQLLGSDAYELVRDALTARLAAVEDQRAVAVTTDVDGWAPTAAASRPAPRGGRTRTLPTPSAPAGPASRRR